MMAVQPTLNDVNTLYDLSSAVIINYFSTYEKELRSLPQNILFDVYFKLYQEKRTCLLGWELIDLNVFERLLKVTHKRYQLLQCFQSLMDHGTCIAQELSKAYAEKCMCSQMCPSLLESAIDLGLRLGGFLCDAGWFRDSEFVLRHCRDLCLLLQETPAALRRTLECYHKLFHVQAAFCLFPAAAETMNDIHNLIKTLRKREQLPNLAALYKEFSIYFFLRSEYHEAHKWGVDALRELVPGLPPSVIIEVLRQLSKTCVVKRQFKKAEVLIRQAVRMANELYDPNHPKLAYALLDYGYFLLHYDLISDCVEVTSLAFDIIKATFHGNKNIYFASASVDLAYALYVREYSTGKFKRARDFAENALSILEELLPPGHLMIASAKRVKALILEEIALDMQSNIVVEALLPDAEQLHITALQLSIQALGDNNVQTAKHYGNLGRLYQSMKKFKLSEEMHLKCISIKEEILGKDDYEVGVSVGHLASLYNYHTKQFEKAEKLYLRSIDIALKLFGDTYSGLEYDYRGLVHVYGKLKDELKAAHYTFILNQWKFMREQFIMKDSQIDLEKTGPLLPIPSIIESFFSD